MSQENKTPAQQLNSRGELNQKQKDIAPRKINYYDVFKKDSDSEPEKIDFDSKICDTCGKDLPLNMFLRSAMETDGHRKTCRDCTKKQKAVKALQEISEYADLDTPFKKEELSRKINIDSALFEYYMDILLELELIKAVKGSNFYILPKTPQLDEYGVSFNSAKIKEKDNFRNKTNRDLNLNNQGNKETKICDTCNKELELSRFLRTHFEPDGYRKTCRECTKKQNAARALKNLLKYIKIDEQFTKKQLESKVNDSFDLYERYIWSLEEIGLVKYDESSKSYILKNTEHLVDFCSEFSVEIPEQKNELNTELSSNHDNKQDSDSLKENKESLKSLQEKKDSILKTKKCSRCKKNLELKDFTKSPAEPDGLDKICLNCKKESQAANGLKKILKYVEMDEPFDKLTVEEKSNIYPILLENYLNILQDIDLISYDKKSKHYVIESGPKFIEFCENNDISLPEAPKKVIEKTKTCNTCGKDLLLSEFPLSFVEADGRQENCNTCRKKIQAAEGLQKLLKIIEIGVPFKKPALLENYLNILLEMDLVEYNAKNKEYTLKKSENLLEFCKKFNIPLTEEIKNKKCASCGNNLPVSNFLKKSSETDGYNKNCLECSEKEDAARGLEKLLKYVALGQAFTKEDLKKETGDEFTLYEKYIKVLEDLGFIKYNEKENNYLLEKNIELYKFSKDFGISLTDFNINKSKITCEICGKHIESSIFRISTPQGQKRACLACSNKENAVLGMNKLIKIVDFNTPFKKEDLIKKMDINPSLFYYYLDILLEMDLINYNESSEEYILEKTDKLEQFSKENRLIIPEGIEKPKVALTSENDSAVSAGTDKGHKIPENDSRTPAENHKICDTCGKELDLSAFLRSRTEPDGYRKTCRNCSKKQNAARGLKKIIEYIDLDTEFTKEYLKKNVNEPFELFENYIFVLQELDLIQYDENKNTLKIENNANLQDFCSEFDVSLGEIENRLSGHKKCNFCGKELPVSQFMKSNREPDGYRKICKSCSKKRTAIQGLKELLKYVKVDQEFDWNYLKNNVKGSFSLFENYIWALQELDLIKYDDKVKKFTIVRTDDFNKFCEEHDINPNQIESIESGAYDLEHKELNEKSKEIVDSLKTEDLSNPDVVLRIKSEILNCGLEAVEPLISLLDDPNPDVRNNSARILGDLKDKRAILPLLKLKNDDDPEVIRAAAYALSKLGDEANFRKFLNLLGSKKYKARGIILDKDSKTKICEACEEELPFEEFYKNKVEPDSLSKKCKQCMKKDNAYRGIKEILRFAKYDIPFKKEAIIKKFQDKNKSRTTVLSYIRPGEELGYLEKIDENTYVIRKNKALYDLLYEFESIEPFELKSNEDSLISNSKKNRIENKIKLCESCGQLLNKKYFYKSCTKGGLSKKCKSCTRKDLAYYGIKELRKYVRLDIAFIKETILKKAEKEQTGISKSTFSSYLNAAISEGYLEELGEDKYVLNKTDALYEFLSQYESIEPFELEESEEKEFNNSTPSTEIKLKICESCGEELPLEEFYKSKAEKDGLSRKCKLCLKKVSAYKGIKELRRLVQFNTAFIKKSKVDQFEEKNDKISRSTFLGYLKAAEDLGYLEKIGENSYILHEKESLDFIEKYEDNLKFELYSSETLKSETSVKTPQIPENILKTMFSQWIFKYEEIQFIPHSENGLKFFKGLLETLEEKEILELIDFDNIEKEKGLLENRLSSNELKEEEIDKISQFLKDILTYLNHRFGDEYWIDAPKKPPIKTYSGNYITELNLWNHQTDAINNWLDNGSRGLLEMATGTGKTLTALGCLKEKIIRENKLLVVIACPFNHLVSQWERELEKIGIFSHKMTADSTNPKWKKELKNALIDIKIGTYNYIIVLTTHKTMSSPKFIDLINDASNKDNETLLIVDEVHGIGAPEMRKGLISRYDYRLGLSATPSRWMDEDGTVEIMDFFQGTVFKFDLQKAINTINPSTGESFLCPYEYKPYLVDLNYEEISSYNELSKKIAQAYSKGNSLPELISNRHEIVDNASNKYGSLKNILDNIPNIQHTLVYCSPRQIESVQKILNEKAIIQHKFTMKEGVNKRKEYSGLSQREYLLKNFDEGVYQALVAIKCLDEGVDIPSAKIAVMMSSTRNPIQYVQRRGRILRRAPGKEKAIIYDLIVIPQPDLEDYEYKKVERELIQKEIDRYREFAATAINHEDCLNVITELEKKLGVDK